MRGKGIVIMRRMILLVMVVVVVSSPVLFFQPLSPCVQFVITTDADSDDEFRKNIIMSRRMRGGESVMMFSLMVKNRIENPQLIMISLSVHNAFTIQ